MNNFRHKRERSQSSRGGFTLLITLILVSVLLGVSGSLLNVTLRQYQLSNISESSEMAFQAADAGIECALYHDFLGFYDENPNSPFDVPGDPRVAQSAVADIDCMGSNDAEVTPKKSGEEQRFEFQWGNPGVCTIVSVYKFNEDAAYDSDTIGINMKVPMGSTRDVWCAEDVECTFIRSRGYNTSCATISTNPRAVERSIVRKY